MWMGIVVLVTFAFAACALLVLAIRGAIARQWHIAISLMVPGVVLGGTIVMMVGPTIMLSLFGNPDLEEVPESAQLVSGSQLSEMLPGHVMVGTYYHEGDWYVLHQSFSDTGFSGFGGPEDAPDTYSWSGSWEIVDNELCLDQGANSLPECFMVYKVGDDYVTANGRSEIEARYQITVPPAEDDESNS